MRDTSKTLVFMQEKHDNRWRFDSTKLCETVRVEIWYSFYTTGGW